MWLGVLWAGLRVAMWTTHVGGKFRDGLLEKSLKFANNAQKINRNLRESNRTIEET